MKPATARVTGMVRVPDLFTSIEAAKTLNRGKLTLLRMVEIYALAQPHAFTDDDLREALRYREDGTERPESSARKRRTELTQRNIILPEGDHSLNRAGNATLRWLHRDFHSNPPPIRPAEGRPSKLTLLEETNARLRAELRGALTRLAEVHDDYDLWREV